MKTVDQLVKASLADMQLPIHYYPQMLHYVLDFCQTELELDSDGRVSRVELTLDANRQADLPVDFDQRVAAYINNGNYLVPIPENKTLKDLGETSSQSSNTVFIPYTNYYHDNFINDYGEHLGKLYGLASGNGQHYSIDNGKIIGGYDFSKDDSIYLDYLSSARYSTATVINARFHRAVRAFAKWKFTDWDRRKNLTQKRMARKEFYNELRKARARTYAMTKEEWLAIFRRNTRQSVKG